jgi:hypothetical protein
MIKWNIYNHRGSNLNFQDTVLTLCPGQNFVTNDEFEKLCDDFDFRVWLLNRVLTIDDLPKNEHEIPVKMSKLQFMTK